MKKRSRVIITLSTIGILLLLVGGYIYYNKLYYPVPPIDGVSQREAITTFERSDDNLALLTSNNKTHWYIASGGSGINVVDEQITELVSQYGWELEQKEGSGLFFTREGEKLIATTRMWTRNYVLIQIPLTFNS
ncbi:MAG: hypothetical protein NAG76_21910 [Candidatus Pristimantibacillus lignocellulolyticus]|uniref:Uncharacterized protein n=1 Tax=Candidatus Pristimantibacillus lignocellulolyticus TaxID=2994561 RepID=A0A9J6ZE60_9BACL|nr:MAG: hypothetical protein NAG76_21910 [Candidatus Pristimantibacillus lignocellulolyticus]